MVCLVFQAEVMFVAMQRDMLETKAEFKGAQKQRNNCQRQKTSIETKIAVSNIYLCCSIISPLLITSGCAAEEKRC